MRETYKYKPTGVCSTEMIFELEDGVIENLEVMNGCNGNLKGISALVRGQKIEDVIDRLEGITCRSKPTSCPDQIAQALKSYSASH